MTGKELEEHITKFRKGVTEISLASWRLVVSLERKHYGKKSYYKYMNSKGRDESMKVPDPVPEFLETKPL